MIRTLFDMALSMRKTAGTPRHFWAEEVQTASYNRNRFPTKVLDDNTTPFEVWTGKKPRVGHMRVWGSECYALIHKNQRKKLHFKPSVCRFIGYTGGGAYKLYDEQHRKILITKDVFAELGSFSPSGPFPPEPTLPGTSDLAVQREDFISSSDLPEIPHPTVFHTSNSSSVSLPP
jgi:hypothetical protein